MYPRKAFSQYFVYNNISFWSYHRFDGSPSKGAITKGTVNLFLNPCVEVEVILQLLTQRSWVSSSYSLSAALGEPKQSEYIVGGIILAVLTGAPPWAS